MSRACRWLRRSRNAYYKQKKIEAVGRLEDNVVKELVLEHREPMPRLGGRKLHALISPSLKAMNIPLGRDRFFQWLKEQDMLVQPKKRYTVTTQSRHRFHKHQNLIKDQAITTPDQVWVSDITYLRLQQGFCYLALITDAYSRKIVGYQVSASLELKGCLQALQMACRQRLFTDSTTHHSDRGIQYCSNKYVEALRKQGIRVSMAEAGNCYENAMAERVNGILKNEFNLDGNLGTLHDARKAVAQAIRTYNERRPHMALNLRTPNEVYAA